MVEGKQVKETLGGFLGAEMVHLICIAAQAAEDVFSSIGGDRDSPAFGLCWERDNRFNVC